MAALALPSRPAVARPLIQLDSGGEENNADHGHSASQSHSPNQDEEEEEEAWRSAVEALHRDIAAADNTPEHAEFHGVSPADGSAAGSLASEARDYGSDLEFEEMAGGGL
jgi:hypothetical protein